jgi:glycosyltransferase involved in cell wall biosynthesis
MNRLSIITINLNNCDGLKKTLKSVFIQEYHDYELIIIDGGSTDGSVEVIKEYKNKIHYWVSEPDNGVYHAMNKGIEKAQGEYLFFLNSGDTLYSENTLSKILDTSPQEQILYGDTYIISANNKKMIKKYPSELTLNFFYNSALCHQASFLKRNLFNDIGLYSEEYKLASDWLFTIEAIILRNVSYRHLDIVVSNYDLSGISFVQKEQLTMERESVLQAIFPKSVLRDYELWKERETKLNNTFFKRIKRKRSKLL